MFHIEDMEYHESDILFISCTERASMRIVACERFYKHEYKYVDNVCGV